MSALRLPLPSRRETIRLGQRLARALGPGDLLMLEGDLGAGKTFLTRAICRAFGVPRAITVASPTFALVHEYEARVRLLHADLYRLDAGRDVAELGLREARAEGAIVVAEWSKRFSGELGDDGLLITLVADESGRHARLDPYGPRGQQLAQAAVTQEG